MRERPDLLPQALETALFLLGLSGIAALFLPFTSNTSPWDVTGDQVFRSGYGVYQSDREWTLFLLGVPFLLAVPISAVSLLLIITRRLARPCWIAAYALGSVAAGGTLYVVYWVLYYVAYGVISDFFYWLLVIPALVVGGCALVIRNARLGLPNALNAIVAMQVAYVAGALLPMIGYFGDWDIGVYITLVTIIVYIGHIALGLSILRRPDFAIGR